MSTDDRHRERLALAHRLADAAGAAILPYFRRPIAVEGKGTGLGSDFDPVTEADRAAEEAMRAMIHESFPGDAVLGEEGGATPGTNAYRWILDPIDGTRAFISGQPMWGTLIALEQEGDGTVFGILDQPFLRERFIGAGGKAEFRSAEGTSALRTRTCTGLGQATLTTTHPITHFDDAERMAFRRVEARAKLSRYGGDCYAYGLLAMGFVDVVMEARLRLWDIAALVPIIEGAGGIVSDWQGNPVRDGGNILAAGDARVHVEALKMIAASG